MDMWDEKKLEEVVAMKHGEAEKKAQAGKEKIVTQIVSQTDRRMDGRVYICLQFNDLTLLH